MTNRQLFNFGQVIHLFAFCRKCDPVQLKEHVRATLLHIEISKDRMLKVFG